MKRVLLVSYYFPPMLAVGGLRALYFARYLSEFGYAPIILTSETEETIQAEALQQLPACCEIRRVANWYRWRQDVSIEAVMVAAQLARDPGFDLVFGTAPTWSSIKTAAIIAMVFRRPLVVDIRDPWTCGTAWFRRNMYWQASNRLWELYSLRRAKRIIYVDQRQTEMMQQRLSAASAKKMLTITHGYDPVPDAPERHGPTDMFLLLHSGNLYEECRPPKLLFSALALACRNPEFAAQSRLLLFGNVCQYKDLVRQCGVEKQVLFSGCLSFQDSIHAMQGADMLVLYQVHREAALQPTSKIYEYLSTRRPILGIIASDGAAADLLRATGTCRVAGNSDLQTIAEGFLAAWRDWRAGSLETHTLDLTRYNRRNLTAALARQFDEILSDTTSARHGG